MSSFSSFFVIFICFTKLCYLEEILGSCSPSYLKLTHTMCKDPNPTCVILKKGVTEEDKSLILDMHNTIRSTVAVGNKSLEKTLPTAADMLEMTWDEELADIAQKHAETCEYGHDCNECRSVDRFTVGQNVGMQMKRDVPEQEEKDWNSFIQNLYEEMISFPESIINSYDSGPNDPKTQYGHFSQIIWADTWRLGCGWVLYQAEHFNNSYYVCNYGPGENILTKKVYTTGSPGSSCARDSCSDEKCVKMAANNTSAKYPGLCSAS